MKADGTVIAVGENEEGQFNTGSWRDVVAVAAGASHTVGLKADGTVVAVGVVNKDVEKWRDIGPVPEELVCNWKGICKYHGGKLYGLFSKKCKGCGRENWGVAVGLKAAGTVVALGDNGEGQCNTGS